MYAQERIKALEQLCRDQHASLIDWHQGHLGRCGAPDPVTVELARRATALLDLDPVPRFKRGRRQEADRQGLTANDFVLADQRLKARKTKG